MIDQWKEALVSTTATTAPSARKRIGFRAKPVVRARRRLKRHLSLVSRPLLDVFRGLVRGKLPWPMYLWGTAGGGKTRACLALCDHVPESYYLTIEDACDAVMARTDGWLWRMIGDYRLVIVDELGIRISTGDLEYTVLKRLADAREDLPAIYAANLPPKVIARTYDDRIASRLLCGTRFHLDDGDRRFGDDAAGTRHERSVGHAPRP